MSLCGVRLSAVCGAAAVAAACVATAGCDVGPAAVPIPYFSASAATTEAMATYDANKDGALDQEELKKVPGLLHHPAKFDPNGDKKVDAAELSARLTNIYGQQVGLMNGTVIVLYNGKPLAGAKIKATPEKFLGAAIKAAEGTTDAQGYASMSIDDADKPADLRGRARVMHNGIYKIEVTHPTIKLPEIYNTASTLGIEVTNDTAIEPAKLELKGK